MSRVESGSGVITIYSDDFNLGDWKEICKAMGVSYDDTQALQIQSRSAVKICEQGKITEYDEVKHYSEYVQKKYIDHYKKAIEENKNLFDVVVALKDSDLLVIVKDFEEQDLRIILKEPFIASDVLLNFFSEDDLDMGNLEECFHKLSKEDFINGLKAIKSDSLLHMTKSERKELLDSYKDITLGDLSMKDFFSDIDYLDVFQIDVDDINDYLGNAIMF